LAAVKLHSTEIAALFSPRTPFDANPSSFLSEGTLAETIEAMDNEMLISKELTRWPCKFFRDFESKGKRGEEPPVQLPIPAKDLSANCSDKYVTCSVQYDFQGG
jgi:hypothetical protein